MPPARVEVSRRLAACASLAAVAAAMLLVAVGLRGQLWRVVAALLLVLVVPIAGWFAVTRRGSPRIVGIVGGIGSVALLAAVALTGTSHGRLLVAVVALSAVSIVLARYALRRDNRTVRQQQPPGSPVGPARHGVLIVNPGSGGGKSAELDLVEEARRRGVEPLLLEDGDDLATLAQQAVDEGADVIGMAGGDGSQGALAAVAMRNDVALVCVPAGTRNHFALDLGLDRDDVLGALDAFGEAIERRIDVARVGQRVFVNNVSLGVYAKLVQSPDYRDAKAGTTAKLLPDLLGPDAPSYDLRFRDDAGIAHDKDQLVEVSNNPYMVTRISGFGTRPRLDTGTLGVTAVELNGAADVTALLAAEAAGDVRRFDGFTGFSAMSFTVESDGPVEAAVDGEAAVLDPPLEFRTVPRAVRVRIPSHAPGYSPAALAAPSRWWTLAALFRAVAGRPTPIDATSR